MSVLIDAEGRRVQQLGEPLYKQSTDVQTGREDENNSGSWLSGGVAGTSSSIFDLNEQQVRNSQAITIRVDPENIPVGVDRTEFVNDYLNKVERDLQRMAPGVTIDRQLKTEWVGDGVLTQYRLPGDVYGDRLMYGRNVYGVVQMPQTRVSGHEQGYRLLDQLMNNPNQVSIAYGNNNVSAEAKVQTDPKGTPFNPGQGSGATVYYDPDNSPRNSVVLSKDVITTASADSVTNLANGLVQASHIQRGTVIPYQRTEANRHFFREGTQNYREVGNSPLVGAEEFRTVGFDGYRMGSEPTENSIRNEIGINEPRASVVDKYDTYNVKDIGAGTQEMINGYEPVSRSEALIGQTTQTVNHHAKIALDGAKGSGKNALIGGGFASGASTFTALKNGNISDAADDIATQTGIGAGAGVTEEVIQRSINGPTSTTSGMTNNAFRTAATHVKGAAAAGAIINTGFAVHDQWDELQSDATRSQAVGTIAGEAVVGAAAGVGGAYAGAMAGAAIGSIVPGVGTVIGGIVGFAVGAGVGYLTDKGLRGLNVNDLVAGGVKSLIDVGGEAAEKVGGSFGGAGKKLGSFFG